MDLETAEEFYRRCTERNAVSESQRIAILKELVKELRVIRLNEKDIQNQVRGKKVLEIRRKFEGDE